MKKLLNTLFIFALACAKLPAQPFAMQRLPNQGELPLSSLYRVLQDEEGYMWYATRGAGLCRDNGYQVDVFRSDRHHPDLLPSNDVTCLVENAAQHEVWFGTRQGLFALSKGDYSVRPVSDSLRGQHVHDLARSSDGRLWAGVSQQVAVFSPQGQLEARLPLTWKGRRVGVQSLFMDAHDVLWATQWNGGLTRIDTRSRQVREMDWTAQACPTAMTQDTLRHHYYIGTWGEGVYAYDGQQARRLELDLKSPAELQVKTVQYDGWRQLLWVVTMAGLRAYAILPDGELAPYPLDGLGLKGHYSIFSLHFDRSGNVWVPGSTPLTFILRPNQGSLIERDAMESVASATGWHCNFEAVVSEAGHCWLWSDRTQLALYDRATGRTAFCEGPVDEGTTRFGSVMAHRRAGGIWAASGRKVFACQRKEGMQIATRLVAQTDKTVSSLYEDGQGNLYIGTANSVWRYNSAQTAPQRILNNTGTVRELQGNSACIVFFIGVKAGLCRLEPSGYKQLAPYNRFTSFTITPDERLWVGNAFGDVWSLAAGDDTLRYEPVASSVRGNGIKRMLSDTEGHVWVLGDIFLKEYSPSSGGCRLLRSQDAEMGMDNLGSMDTDAQGRVLVAGGGGLLALHSSTAIDQPVAMLQPAVATYVADGEVRQIGYGEQHISIAPGTATLELQLTTFDALDAHKQQFAYRLNGRNSQWVTLPMGQNTIRLVNLRRGAYTLELKACDALGRWGEPVHVLSITRQPAWFETWWAFTAYCLLAAALVALALWTYLRHRRELDQRNMNERLAEMKLRFFTNVSHELRTPLSLIITPLDSILGSLPESAEALRPKLQGVQRHADELLGMVNRLLDFRKLNMGELRLHPSPGDVLEFLRTCVTTFQPVADGKGVALRQEIPDGTLYTSFDRKAMQHVMYNLLSNALKYTDEGSVTVRALATGEATAAAEDADGEDTTGQRLTTLTIEIQDTGTGIAPDELPHIFDRYYQASNADDRSVAGSGIGLSMVKELATQMGATIQAASTPGKGTTLTLRLPLSRLQQSGDLPAMPVIPKLPTLLVADDNDDFRDFLVQELKDHYNILQARNGREALKMAQTHYVDVLLSDVMMPQMDGNELCRQLKQDEATSHIFIMLLTAKTAEESVLEGYQAGADFYLTKPFSLELLRNRLSHLAKMQQRRIELLAKASTQAADAQHADTEDTLRISPIDRKFIEKLRTVMQQNVANSSFGVDAFCSEMAMSRMNFYRKMHALTGQTPAQYINDFRLQLADRLLREGELNVSEIADRTGFSTSSYFSKCYKARFGVAPKEARNR